MYTAAHAAERPYVQTRDMADALGVSFFFLTKVLQDLNHLGILTSCRGPAGGVALARRPESISLLDIVNQIEGEDIFSSCLLGLEGCGERKPCPLHGAWVEERRRLRKIFAGTRLSDVAEPVIREVLRLSD